MEKRRRTDLLVGGEEDGGFDEGVAVAAQVGIQPRVQEANVIWPDSTNADIA